MMSAKQNMSWSRLDNAAKIFPATSIETDTRVFRFSCELYEEIVPEILQESLETALNEYPNFRSVMKYGFFWYYLEYHDIKPVIEKENEAICPHIYNEYESTLLFNVTYYKCRINLEMYHVLSDGTGALQFLKAIVYHYLLKNHKKKLGNVIPILDGGASFSEKKSDSFQKYYQKIKPSNKAKPPKVYCLKGERRTDGHLQTIDGVVSVKSVLDAAHRFNTTLTVFLTSVLIEAVQKEMSLENKQYPVVLRVPVNLRQYFPSETTMNFFGTIEVGYDFQQGSGEFADVINTVDKCFKSELKKERLAEKMSGFAALERNPFIRIVPLSVKNAVIRSAKIKSDKTATTVLSNVGKITMPEELTPYIRLFGVYASTRKLQLCMCSFGDNLQLGFTSAFVSTDIQKNFFRMLSENGIEAEIRCNDFYSDGE